MSKDHKMNYDKAVEIVEKCSQVLSYISGTLTFWKLDTSFPCNLIKKCVDDLYDEIVSVSHIIDK